MFRRKPPPKPTTLFSYEEVNMAMSICAGLEPAEYVDPLARAVIEKAKAQVAKAEAHKAGRVGV